MAEPIPPNSRKEQYAAARQERASERSDALRRVIEYRERVGANWAIEQAARILQQTAPRMIAERTESGAISLRPEYDPETAEALEQLVTAARMIAEQERAVYGIRRPLQYYDERVTLNGIPLIDYRRFGLHGPFAYPDGDIESAAGLTAEQWAEISARVTPPANW